MPDTFDISFDESNPEALDFASREAARRVTDITEEIRQVLRGIVSRMYSEHVTPALAARMMRNHIGLNQVQSDAVMNLYDLLRDPKMFGRRVYAGNVPIRIPLEGFDEETLFLRAGDYAERLLNQRCEAIARTEAITASNAGQQALWAQAVSEGLLSGREQRVWLTAPEVEGRPDAGMDCPVCGPMDGQLRDLDEDFETPDGEKVPHPPAHVQCRCGMGISRKSREDREQEEADAALEAEVQAEMETLSARLLGGPGSGWFKEQGHVPGSQGGGSEIPQSLKATHELAGSPSVTFAPKDDPRLEFGVGGYFDPDTGSIVVAEGSSAPTIAHELGHAVDAKLGDAATTSDFGAAFKSDRDSQDIYDRNFLRSSRQGTRREIFAELVALVTTGEGAAFSGDRLRRAFPKTADYIAVLLGKRETRNAGGPGSGWTREGGHIPGSQGGSGGGVSRFKESADRGDVRGFETEVVQLAEGLPGPVRGELNGYKSFGYKTLNTALRRGDPSGEVQERIGYLDSAFTQKLEKPVTVFRGGFVPKDAKAGMLFQDKAYLSTSLSMDVAGDFLESSSALWHIRAPKGTPFALPCCSHMKEFELLLPRGSRFRIRSLGNDVLGRRVVHADLEL